MVPEPQAIEAVAHAGASMVSSAAPMMAVFLPFLMSVPIYLAGNVSERLRNLLSIATAGASFYLIASLYPLIEEGSSVVYTAPVLMLDGMSFFVDGTGFIFAAVTSFVWLLATIYSTSYMTHEHSRDRFFAFLILTLAADLGVLLTGDLFSLFIFFELLGLSSWVLVIHSETQEAMRAGKKYLFMGVIGGLFLLFGIFFVFTSTDTLLLQPLLGGLAGLGDMKYLIAASMTLGFGVKAGMFPVHVWLPEAHPVAPSPASALLSGIMVKAGVYGIIRTLLLVFSPTEGAEHLWSIMAPVGSVMIWIGVITMFVGMVLALLQTNLKRLLAYSTISQIGYIVFGIGIAVFLGFEGALGLAGAVYHFLNHALYKSLLFLMAGAIYFRTHELDMRRFGGLYKKMPFTFVFGLVAVLGITGIPLFNGFVSKTLLFEGVVEAAHVNSVFLIAEVMFLVTSGGTIAYYLKMLVMTFFGSPGEVSEKASRAPLAMLVPMGVLAALIVFIGVFPGLVLERLVYPVFGGYTFDVHAVEHVLGTHFFTVHGLGEVLLVSVIGVSIFTLGWRKDLLFVEIPRPLGPDYWFEKVGVWLIWLAKGPFTTLDSAIDRGYVKTGKGFLSATKAAMEIDEKIDHTYVETGHKFLEATIPAQEFDKKIDRAYVETGERLIETASPTKVVAQTQYEGFKRLREPITIFDQSAEEFFTEVASDVIDAIKYPYAALTLFFDIIVGKKDTKDIKSLADEFETKMRTFLAETPNISGISIAVVIIVGMLAIYLFTAVVS
jgi:formate hydrogenlyase subunit 3/multisubunit Na+/H+ antiporter MnhD subunit